MDQVCSVAYPVGVGNASVAVARDASRSLVRWVAVGAAGVVLMMLAIMQSASVGAAAPAEQGNYCINYTTCYTAPGTTVATPAAVVANNTTTGYPANTVVSTYIDPRYCNGVVSVVTDSTGHLIDVCAATGQRIIPIFPDYGYGLGVGANFIGANYSLNGGFVNGGFANGGFANGGFFNNGNTGFNFVNGNTFPAGATYAGSGVYTYNDNRFCTNGMVAFAPGRGYFCQNGGPLVPNGATNVNCGNFSFNGCGVYRPFAVSDTAPATTQTTVAAPAAAPAAQQSAPAATTVHAQSVTAAPAAAVNTAPPGSRQVEGGRD